jgi:hypothetical protein
LDNSAGLIGCGIRTVARRCLQTTLAVSFAIVLTAAPRVAKAQDDPILQKGDAVVTGYSGIALLKPSKGGKQVDYAVINSQGASLQVFDMSQMDGREDARVVKAARNFSIPASKIGQVFGVALDNGKGGKTPNIYATATSMFGLQIVKTAKGVRERAKVGGPNRTWMSGQFGIALGGGPGSIWKIDGLSGEVSLFADVKLDGRTNSGPGLGNIAFDRRSKRLFVSDRQTGMIHSFDLSGREIAVFDHGRSARPKLGLPEENYDPASRVEITSAAFVAGKPETWGFAPTGRDVWGLATFKGRLYYAVAEGPEIWSVGIGKDGDFRDDARVEVEVNAPSGDAVSDISFARNGTMFLSQRGTAASSYDYTTWAKPKTASVLRFRRRKLPSGRVAWRPVPEEYSIGFAAGFRNGNGGHALGYGYDQYGSIRHSSCEQMLWSTGERLRQNPKFKTQLTKGGPTIVHGMQGNRAGLVKPANEEPFEAYFIDFDGRHADPKKHGHLGDIAIWSTCGGKGGGSDADDREPPSGPRISIAKSCSAALFGGKLQCRVTLRNSGSEAPSGRVAFLDNASTLIGSNTPPTIVDTIPDDSADWDCSTPNPGALDCSIAGAELKPGTRRSVSVVMDVSALVGTPDWKIRNCAKLDGSSQKKCVTRGSHDSLIVTKTGPNQKPCIAGGPCDFRVSVINPGNRTFNGALFFGDNLTLSGIPAGSIKVDGVSPTHDCTINSLQLPLEWECDVSIPAGGEKTFDILMTIPNGAVPPAGAQGRNCFVAPPSGLALTNNQPPANFWNGVLNPANPGNNPGAACVSFSVLPANAVPIPPFRKPGLPIVGPFGPPILPGSEPEMEMVVTAKPTFFTKPGQVITFTYEVSNTGNVPITSFTITDTKVSPGGPIGNCNSVDIPVSTSVTCSGTYVTTAADMNANIVTPATVTGIW